MFATMLPAGVSFADTESTISDPYFMQLFTDLNDRGSLELAGGITAEKTAAGDGVVLTGKKQVFLDNKILIREKFDFDKGNVGRIALDAVGDKGLKVKAEIYLDDSEEPLKVIPLKNQMGKKPWTSKGAFSADAVDAGITGQHSVYLRLVDESSKGNDKKMSVCLKSIEFAEQSLPVLYFNIDETMGTVAEMNSDPEHDTECYGDVTVQIPDGYVSEYTDSALTTETIPLEYIRGRGNSTWDADKKPYKVKLDKKKSLFGMEENKHWVLLANRYDNSFMRNKMTYWLGQELDMEFTPQSVPVEVVMNGQYYGLYYLTEQIRVGTGRVDIDDLDDTPDSTDKEINSGGYLISMEPYDYTEQPDNTFKTDANTWYIESPSFEDYFNKDQKDYISNYFNDTEKAIFGQNGKKYTDYLDLDAAVKYFWIQEFSKNGDAYGSGSTYLYKKRNGKLFWGPLWDFDYVAWGDLEYEGSDTEGLNYTSTAWFDRMRRDDAFAKKAMEFWPKLKAKVEYVTKDGGLLDQYYEQLKTAREYDHEKWGSYGNDYFDEGTEEEEAKKPDRTYSEEVEQLRGWIKSRTAWVNDNYKDNIRPLPYKVKFKANNKVIKTRTVFAGDPIGDLPNAPKKDGYVFAGWYYMGFEVAPDNIVYEAMTVTAKYVKKSKAVKAENVYFAKSDIIMMKGDQDYVECKVMPENATSKKLTWKSSDPSVAAVSAGGTLNAVKKGKTTVSATLPNGKKATCVVYVVDEDYELNDLESTELSKKSVKIRSGKYTQIRVKYTPAPCWHSEGKIISGDDSICEIDEFGIVTGKKPGKTTAIYISDEGGEVIKIPVTVTGNKPAKVAIKKVIKKKKSVTVRWKRQSAIVNTKKISGYQIKIARNKKFTKSKRMIKVKGWKKTSKKIGKLKSKKTYYLRIRAYQTIDGKTYYSKWSKIRKVKTK